MFLQELTGMSKDSWKWRESKIGEVFRNLVPDAFATFEDTMG